MATINKLPSGKTRVRFRLGGRRDSRTFDTKREANAFIASLGAGEEQPAPQGIRLDAWVAEWYPTHAITVKPSTAATYKDALNRYVLPYVGFLTLDQLTSAEVRAWQVAMTRRGYAPATVKLGRAPFCKALNGAVRDGHIPANPFDEVDPVKVAKSEIRILREEEVHTLADVIDPRYRALVLLSGYCGLRIGELCALRLRDLELAEMKVSIRTTLTKVEKSRRVEGPAKTAASRRTLSVPRSLVDELEHHIASGYANDVRVFTSPWGRLLRPENFRDRTWKPAVEQACIGELTPHDLRHTAVSLWIRQGASPKLVAYRAGHASVAYVIDTYGHLFDDEDAQLAAKLDEGWVSSAAAPGADTRRVRGVDGPVDRL